MGCIALGLLALKIVAAAESTVVCVSILSIAVIVVLRPLSTRRRTIGYAVTAAPTASSCKFYW